MERNFINDMHEGLELLETLTSKLGRIDDQTNATLERANHGHWPLASLDCAIAVERCLSEAQRACRDFDARLEKLRSER